VNSSPDLTLPDLDGNTVIHIAAQKNSAPLLSALLAPYVGSLESSGSDDSLSRHSNRVGSGEQKKKTGVHFENIDELNSVESANKKASESVVVNQDARKLAAVNHKVRLFEIVRSINDCSYSRY
jgi:ankyrin repeat protein